MTLETLIIGDEGHRLACGLAGHGVETGFIRSPQPCVSQLDLNLLTNPALQSPAHPQSFTRSEHERSERRRMLQLRRVQREQRSRAGVENYHGRVQLRSDGKVVIQDGSKSRLIAAQHVVIATGSSPGPSRLKALSDPDGSLLTPLRPAHWGLAAGPQRRSLIVGWNPWTILTAIRLAVSGGSITLVDAVSDTDRIPGDLVRMRSRLEHYGISLIQTRQVHGCRNIGSGIELQTDREFLRADFLFDGSRLQGNTAGLELARAGLPLDDSQRMQPGSFANRHEGRIEGFGQVVSGQERDGREHHEMLNQLLESVAAFRKSGIRGWFREPCLLPFPGR